MIRLDDVLVLTPQITPVEARFLVTASWKCEEQAASGPTRLKGTVVGPLCEYADTLSTRVELKQTAAHVGRDPQPTHLMAAARILEPCFWGPEHPFCYELQLELHGQDRLLDMRRFICGIRHLAVQRTVLLFNGQACFLQGVWHPSVSSITELQAWHELECSAFLTAATPELCDRTDRFGPIVLHLLPPITDEANDQVARLRNHPSVLMWVVPAEITSDYRKGFIKAIRGRDPSRPIGQLVSIDQMAGVASSADVLFLPPGHPEIGNPQAKRPYIIVGRFAGYTSDCTPGNFTERVDAFRQSLGEQPGLVGVIL